MAQLSFAAMSDCGADGLNKAGKGRYKVAGFQVVHCVDSSCQPPTLDYVPGSAVSVKGHTVGQKPRDKASDSLEKSVLT